MRCAVRVSSQVCVSAVWALDELEYSVAREVRAAASVARTWVARVRRVLGHEGASDSFGLIFSPVDCWSYGILAEGIAESFFARFGDGRSMLSSLVWGVRRPVGRLLLGREYRRLLWDCVNAILRKSMVGGGVVNNSFVRKSSPVGEPSFSFMASQSPDSGLALAKIHSLYCSICTRKAFMGVFQF